MPRLSADIVVRAPHRINPVRERELDLRGNKLPAIENLGATQDQFDAIDLSDNEIGKLENFPLLTRLRTLIINNNHITKIAPNLSESLPNIESLILTNNRIVNLPDLDPLADLATLRTLSVLENVVSKKPNYRLYIITKLPDLRILDFRKVKRKEREEAVKLFGPPFRKPKKGQKNQQPAQQAPAAEPSKTFVPGEVGSAAPTPTPAPHPQRAATEAQIAFKVAVQNAKTMEEVTRLERAINNGGTAAAVDADMTEAEPNP